ncbi:relaxase/mobilization nuclease domain-containing protein [Ruminococcaceae bacterium OttesenSCG-928-D13]|nr:relaxase/mobilization nuclease domain-containing protein [Ruminococcaceae bacterium OttesenSCG-928-D13]
MDYAMNPDKVTEHHPQHDDLGNVLSYATRDEAVEYVTGLNCLPVHAKEQMKMTKQAWNKTGGILAFHAYQSFKPGETTPEQAHAVGVEFAQRMWGDRFQVIVATHTDQEHLHNHFVINSVSFVDGKKYYDNKQNYYNGVRALSDQVCREFGLSVIEHPKGKGKHYKEAIDEKAGKPTPRNLVRADVHEAIEKSPSFHAFVEYMAHKGYTVKCGPKVTHIAVRPQGSEDFIRLYRLLGPEYEESGIRAMIEGMIPIPAMPGTTASAHTPGRGEGAPKRSRPRVFRMPREHKRLKGIRATYYKYLYLLGKAGKRKLPNRAAFVLRSDIAKFERYNRQFRFLREKRIGTDTELSWYADALKTEIEVLVAWRKPFYALRREASPAEQARLTAQIDKANHTLRQLRRDLRMCEQISQDTPVIRAQAERAVAQLEQAGQEQREHKKELRPKLGRSEHS